MKHCVYCQEVLENMNLCHRVSADQENSNKKALLESPMSQYQEKCVSPKLWFLGKTSLIVGTNKISLDWSLLT